MVTSTENENFQQEVFNHAYNTYIYIYASLFCADYYYRCYDQLVVSIAYYLASIYIFFLVILAVLTVEEYIINVHTQKQQLKSAMQSYSRANQCNTKRAAQPRNFNI